MKISFQAKKGERIKRYYMQFCIIDDKENWCYIDEIGQWVKEKDITLKGYYSTCNYCCITKKFWSLKTALRIINKTTKYVPKGTKILLENYYENQDVILTL